VAPTREGVQLSPMMEEEIMDRRKFLRTLGLAGAAAAFPWQFDLRTFKFMTARAYPFAQSPTNIRKFVSTLPGLGPGGANNIGQYIPLATKTQRLFANKLTDVYHLGVEQFKEKMHPDLKNATQFWGYFDLATRDQQYLAGAIVATKGTPVLLNVTNNLPKKALIPIDSTIMAGPNGLTVGQLPQNRIATHVHGGLTPWFSDGTPFQWYDPKGMTGPSFMNVPGTKPPVGTATNYYPMNQSARLLWYHDHAIGITRTNAYSGIASALILTDDYETGLVSGGLLPDLLGIPLIIQDKTFVSAHIKTQDPTWQWGKESDLWYPHEYEANVLLPFPPGTLNPKGRWDYGATVSPTGQVIGPLPGSRKKKRHFPAKCKFPLPKTASIVPEFFADTILVNGAPYPVVSVPPKRVRFRMLNGSQARFYHVNLYPEASPGEAQVGTPGPIMYQVGTEGGFLTAVAVHNNTTPCPLDLVGDPSGNTANPDGPFNLLLAPAERADVVIDFNGVPAGTSFILYNDPPAPFPGGDPRNDYFTGDPDFTDPSKNAFGLSGGAPTTVTGHGPNTRTLMKIVVTSGSGDSVATPTWLGLMNNALQTAYLTGAQNPLLYTNGNPSVPKFPFSGSADRRLTLNEDFDEFGRLIQTIGTFTSKSTNSQGLDTWGLPYMADSTENPMAGATEVWQIFNLTGDTHPIHFHLVNVQVIQRQPFSGVPGIQGADWQYTGPEMPPDANEVGWKETVRMNPGEVTTVIMKFDLPTLPAAMGDPLSPRTGGHEYVWHCHILEHEEHDMMRPLVVS
jgi:spore coat protein A, manganese oxidase